MSNVPVRIVVGPPPERVRARVFEGVWEKGDEGGNRREVEGSYAAQ